MAELLTASEVIASVCERHGVSASVVTEQMPGTGQVQRGRVLTQVRWECAVELVRMGRWSPLQIANLLGLKSRSSVLRAIEHAGSIGDVKVEVPEGEEPDPNQIIAEVCRQRGMDVAELHRRGEGGFLLRTKDIAECRRACAAALYQTGRWTQKEVGKLLGLNSHASLYSVLSPIAGLAGHRERQEHNGPSAETVNLDSLDDMLDFVCEKYAVTPPQVMSGGKHVGIVNARAEFCWRCRTELAATHHTIAAFLGVHHSNVVYLIGRHAYHLNGGVHVRANKKAYMAAARGVAGRAVTVRPRHEKPKRRTLAEWREECRKRALARAEEIEKKFSAASVKSPGSTLLSMDELGAHFGVSRETVAIWEREAMSKLRTALLNDPYIQEWVRENT